MTLVILGCGGFELIAQPALTSTIEPTWTISPLPSPTITDTVTPTFLPTETFTPSPTSSPTFTFTPTITPTPEFIFQGPGEILVPILLYHHVGISPKGSQYYISPEEFDKQMALLYAWGYKTIPVELLVDAIQHGAQLPAQPIILTFDDGSETVYTDAFPIMEKYGFTGTAFIVYNYVGASLYMDVDQIRALYDAGWEIGSHSLSHVNLRQRPNLQEREIVESQRKLEARLDVPISIFAYPFGAYNADSVYYVRSAGYLAAAGLGADMHQGSENIYYLYRREIKSSYDLTTFVQFLPWQKDLNNLPAVTVVP